MKKFGNLYWALILIFFCIFLFKWEKINKEYCKSNFTSLLRVHFIFFSSFDFIYDHPLFLNDILDCYKMSHFDSCPTMGLWSGVLIFNVCMMNNRVVNIKIKCSHSLQKDWWYEIDYKQSSKHIIHKLNILDASSMNAFPLYLSYPTFSISKAHLRIL